MLYYIILLGIGVLKSELILYNYLYLLLYIGIDLRPSDV